LRAVLDGILYVLHAGCAWRHLPHEFPPWGTVHRWFLRLSKAGVCERLAHALTMADRERAGRDASPTGAILDAQVARSGGVGMAGARGNDPARRVVGRKRHALTDTDGRLLVAAVSPADLHDSHGGIALLRASRGLWPFLAHCFAYRGDRIGSATAITVEIVESEEGQTGFAVQPRRWVIERTFGWISRCRRLARDHEATASSALAFFLFAAAIILVRRLARAL
jgi:transposase